MGTLAQRISATTDYRSLVELKFRSVIFGVGFIALLAVFAAPMNGFAQTFYLDKSAAGAADGASWTNAWTSIDQALTAINARADKGAGSTLLLKNGQYALFYDTQERSGWLNIAADQGNTNVYFTGIYLARPGRIHYSPKLAFNGINVNAPTSTGDYIVCWDVDDVIFDNVSVIGDGYQDNDAEGGWNLWGANNITINQCTVSGTGPAETMRTSVKYGIKGRNSNNVSVTNSDIGGSGVGIQAWGVNWDILNNNIHDLTSDGILVGCRDALIKGNQVHDIRKFVVSLVETPTSTTWSSDGRTLYGNGSKWNTPGVTKVYPGYEMVVLSGNNAAKTTYVVSQVLSDTQMVLSSSVGTNPSNVDYRIGSRQHCDIIQMYNMNAASSDGVDVEDVYVIGNKLYNCDQQGIWLGVGIGTNIIFENNLITGCWQFSGWPQAGRWFFATNITNLVLRNNTIAASNTDSMIALIDITPGTRGLSLTMENNIFDTVDIWTGVTVDYEDYNVLRRWWAHMSPDFVYGQHDVKLGTLTNFLSIFENPGAGQYTLSANSPAIDLCLINSAPSGDINNAARVDIPGIGNEGVNYADAGCFEFGSYTEPNEPNEPNDPPVENQLPVWEKIGNKSVGEGSLLSFDVDVYDPDGDLIIINVDTLPPGAVFTGKTFGWIPGPQHSGNYTVTFTASDQIDEVSHTITIMVMNAIPGADITVPDDYSTIQQAIDASSSGDLIIVKQGRYYESINFKGKNIILTSSSPYEEQIVENTIIDANNKQSVVVFNSGETAEAVLTGFTITGGNAYQGGGVNIEQASPIIKNNIITNNNASMYGGGIYCIGASPVIMNNRIINNSSEAGVGGGLSLQQCDAVLSNNVIAHNFSLYGGSAILWYGGTCTLTNNTIANNDSPFNWVSIGLIIDAIYPSMVKNNIIAFNNHGIGMWTPHESPFTNFKYNDVYANTNGNYDGELLDMTEQNGNIALDPLFADTQNLDYHLMSTAGSWEQLINEWVNDALDSPCIDAGDPADSTINELRHSGDRINMGAYGGTIKASLSTEF
jgi:hypothetical protein